ncbi:MAG: hypothetical protein EBU84_06280, partial [Actinobacteria bacterium]|nr:hypothetical protein [Actinomycetota bacterium]
EYISKEIQIYIHFIFLLTKKQETQCQECQEFHKVNPGSMKMQYMMTEQGSQSAKDVNLFALIQKSMSSLNLIKDHLNPASY